MRLSSSMLLGAGRATPCLKVLILILIVCVPFSSQFGRTLTFQSSLRAHRSNDPHQFQYSFNPEEDVIERSGLNRRKRDVSESPSDSKIIANVTSLNDSHNSLIVYWAGKDVIICLAKDLNVNSSSTLYISRNYGASFENSTHLLTTDLTGDEKPILDKFFNHPDNNGKFVFTDVQNKVLYTTDNYGAEFRKTYLLCVPDEVLFDPYAEDTILVYEKSTVEKRLWISKDFGMSWNMVQEYVKSVAYDESTHPARLYIQREEPDEESTVLTSNSSFLEHGDAEVVLSEVEEFEIKDDYLFATKKGPNNELELWISYKRGPFLHALFPTTKAIRNYHIADVFDGQMFVCVTHDNSISDLYIGSQPPHNLEIPRFSLSLTGIVYFKPNLTWSGSWINDVTEEPFLELHRVEGLRGVYIANVLKNTSTNSSKIDFNQVVSKVTYDNGGEWESLKPPAFNDDGQPIYCQYLGVKTENCSLQINQRLSELYPVTRSVPILSKKSAVGLVLASGTVEKSLKSGQMGVYLSTDGAITWKQILQGNYLFGFGDHGGVIVAVKFYRIGEATNSLLYTTNEGVTWKTYQFHNESVRVLGLMTEPGENTTVFFVFGSVANSNGGKTSHSWILIRVDFMNAFDGKCDASTDYKIWSPWDSKPGRDCLLGKKDQYERRIPSHSCYNGRSYERVVRTTKCLCDRIDFECDFGYVEDELDGNICKKDTSDASPGVKPEWCRPGDRFYNITRGYRKIPGDECEGGDVSKYLPQQRSCAVSNETEFMLVAKRDSVLRIDLNDFSRAETLPLLNVRAVIACDYDQKSGYVYWADVNKDNIMRIKLDGKSVSETLVSQDLKSVEGLALDWVTKNLYFCDAANAKIEVIRTDVSNFGRMRKVVLDKTHLEKPRGIAVHPEKAYLFWSDWSNERPCIGRSWLDGSHVERIVENTPGEDPILRWPNGIALDFKSDQIYWVDAFLDQMVRADLDGKNVKVFLKADARIRHPFAVAVYKDFVYWDDWQTHSIYGTRTDSEDPTKEVFLVTSNSTRLMDLKVFGPSTQLVGTTNNSCASHNCTHLCLNLPEGKGLTCECPDGLKKVDENCVCPDGKPTDRDGRCSTSTCKDNNSTFRCASNEFCIPLSWKCDGDNDCGDNSDEDPEVCDTSAKCNPAQFQCHTDKKCIPDGWKCDYDPDCSDGSDEKNCEGLYPACNSTTHFECHNKRCILIKWRCDGDNDCMDNSDELDCQHVKKECGSYEFMCDSKDRCISDQYRCDGDYDCPDHSDENNCTDIACPDYKFHCKESNQCIMESWHCDGDRDCTQGEDEVNCTSVATVGPTMTPFPVGDCSKMKQMFQCYTTSKCIPTSWRCDGQFDCGGDDHSDEMGCANHIETSTSQPPAITIEPHHKHCSFDHWQCESGDCIQSSSVCDKFPDCPDQSDEKSCQDPSKGPSGCSHDQIRCGMSNVCVLKARVCDGHKDCPNNADENACVFGNITADNPCNRGQHTCDDNMCIALSKMCNGKADCVDRTDEIGCSSFKKVYQVEGISANTEGIEASEIEIEWWVNPELDRRRDLLFKPSFCEISSGHCKNTSEWIKNTKYTFKDLSPFTRYSITVFARLDNDVFPPAVYSEVSTIEYEPSPPYQLVIKQNSVDKLCASWKKPHTPNGIIRNYTLYFSPPKLPASVVALSANVCISNKQSDPPFQPGTEYTFWVEAENSLYKSKPSESVVYKFTGDAGKVVNVKSKDATENSVTLAWTTTSSNSSHVLNFNYNVTVTLAGSSYPFEMYLTSDNPYITVKNLAPGTKYNYEIIPIHKEGIRGVSYTGIFQTKGDKLPMVDGIIVSPSNKTNEFIVRWIPPKPTKQSWSFAVFYGKTIEEITEQNNPQKVKDFPVMLKNLEACENYFVDVAVMDNGAVGPLTEKPASFKTTMDVTAPPKRVHIVDPIDELNNVKVTVAWESPCPVMSQQIGYNITLRDVRLHSQFGLSNISFSNSSRLEYAIDIQYGGRYEVTVSTSAVGGRKSGPVIVQGPDIPFPLRVHQCEACLTPTITWEEPTLPNKVTMKGNVTYVVWLSKDFTFTSPSTYTTYENMFPFNHLADDNVYYVAVSVRDVDGLESPKSSIIAVQDKAYTANHDAVSVSLDERSLVGIVVTVIVVLAILIAALTLFVVRHKRLQTSFLNFASSHYSTQSGSATFQHNLEEEQDSPVIRGFSDDEPLLVA